MVITFKKEERESRSGILQGAFAMAFLTSVTCSMISSSCDSSCVSGRSISASSIENQSFLLRRASSELLTTILSASCRSFLHPYSCRKPAEGIQEGFLHDVFRFCCIVYDPEAGVVHGFIIQFVDLELRFPVSCFAGIDQILVNILIYLASKARNFVAIDRAVFLNVTTFS